MKKLEEVESILLPEVLAKIPPWQKGLSLLVSAAERIKVFRNTETGGIFTYDKRRRVLSIFGSIDGWENFREATQIRCEVSHPFPDFTVFSRTIGIINTADEPFNKINSRLRRELQSLNKMQILETEFSINHPEWKRTIVLLGKFLAVRGFRVEFPESILAHAEDSSFDRIRVGSIKIGTDELRFISTVFDDTLCGDYYFQIMKTTRLNLSTIFHQQMINRAHKLGLPHYSFGTITAEEFNDYEGVSAYKRQWHPAEHELKVYLHKTIALSPKKI